MPGDRGDGDRRRVRGAPLVAGRFIAREGVDGSGKSTQAAMLADALEARGVRVVRTREPGGTPVGERVREILLAGAPGELELTAEALLFAAARAELMRRVIAPALADGAWVVCDRFLDSSLAYQGAARGLGLEAVLQVNRLAVDGRLPDRSLVIDVPIALATSRRCATPDRIEAEGDGFLARVAAGYHELAGMYPDRVRLVDGTGTPDEVHARVLDAVDDIGDPE
ncbi:MAG TPA: dTMP kinase [Miltoncostaea sp.]|nr:dTMP kinase [Miltoncostaea sp.]